MKQDEKRQTSFAHRFDAEEAEAESKFEVSESPTNKPRQEVDENGMRIIPIHVITVLRSTDDADAIMPYLEHSAAKAIEADLLNQGFDPTGSLLQQNQHFVTIGEDESFGVETYLNHVDGIPEISFPVEHLINEMMNGPAKITAEDLRPYIVIGWPEAAGSEENALTVLMTQYASTLAKAIADRLGLDSARMLVWDKPSHHFWVFHVRYE